jgi:hypothetical protein
MIAIEINLVPKRSVLTVVPHQHPLHLDGVGLDVGQIQIVLLIAPDVLHPKKLVHFVVLIIQLMLLRTHWHIGVKQQSIMILMDPMPVIMCVHLTNSFLDLILVELIVPILSVKV